MAKTPHGRPRPRRTSLRAASTLALLLASAAVAYGQCAPDPDTDGDGVCDPVDNCVAVPNPDQLDTYGASSSSPAGAFGDACEPIDAEANVVKVKIRAGGMGVTPKGKVTVKGDFVLLVGESFAPASIGARVVDGLSLDQETPAPGGSAAICAVSASGRNIRCKQTAPQASLQTTARFKLSSASSAVARVVKFSLKIAKLAISGGAFSEPVTVTLTDLGSGLDRVGIIHDCAAANGQLTCREL
jgi:hypothetical protein